MDTIISQQQSKHIQNPTEQTYFLDKLNTLNLTIYLFLQRPFAGNMGWLDSEVDIVLVASFSRPSSSSSSSTSINVSANGLLLFGTPSAVPYSGTSSATSSDAPSTPVSSGTALRVPICGRRAAFDSSWSSSGCSDCVFSRAFCLLHGGGSFIAASPVIRQSGCGSSTASSPTLRQNFFGLSTSASSISSKDCSGFLSSTLSDCSRPIFAVPSTLLHQIKLSLNIIISLF